MVRTAFLNDINKLITSSGFFDVDDFDIGTEDDGKSYKLTIVYRHNNRFWFVAAIPKAQSQSTKISVNLIPGEINANENSSVESKYELHTSIREWIGRLREELLAIPVYRQVDEQRQQIDEMVNRLKNVEDVAFTRDEADKLKAELDNLREQMIEHIKASSENERERENSILTIKNDVDNLKASVEILTKPNWARAAMSRFYKWSKDTNNRGLIKDGVEVATKLLSGGNDGK